MDGLIVLLLLIPVVFLILLLVLVGRSSTHQQSLDSITKLLARLSDQLYDLDKKVKDMQEGKPAKPEQPTVKDTPTAVPEKPVERPVPPPVMQRPPRPVRLPEQQEAAFTPLKEESTKPAGSVPKSEVLSKEPALFQQERTASKSDWEKFIGENLANKIGIAVLVLGISFFVKFAIDKNWINEAGRVIIGLVSGAILVALAHRMRNSYRSFSSVLVGGGLAVFYFTVAFAFHQYELIGQQAAFILMIVITGFAVALSILYNRIELAVLATVGGFITPFLVSTGQNNYIALFTYLCILNAGLLVLSWFKHWKAINIIALFFTVIIFGGWLLVELIVEDNTNFPYKWALTFASLFYALSIAINIVNKLKLSAKFGGFDFILLLSINFLYFLAGIAILNLWNNGAYQGLFTASLGAINLALAWIFFRKKMADRNFTYLLIGLTVTFISLTAPVQLEGNHITLFWAAESVVLFWLYRRSGIALLKISALLILAPLLISLFMDWSMVYGTTQQLIPVAMNRGFTTTLVTAIAIFLFYIMQRNELETHYAFALRNATVRALLLALAALLAYAAGAFEIVHQFRSRLPGTLIHQVYFQLYSLGFILLALASFKRPDFYPKLKFILTAAGLVLYLVHLRVNHEVSLQMLSTGRYTGHFTAHWLSAGLLLWLLYDLCIFFRKRRTEWKELETGFTWAAAACIIFCLSVEMYYVILWTAYRSAVEITYWENIYLKAGLSILWGMCSFAMIWLGMKYRFRMLRVISLTLFTITLVKLFLFDISNMPPGGKIAAFILLGALLLIISFMYQRLKKIIIDDQQNS